VLRQSDTRSWRVDVRIAAGTRRSTVAYPDLGCEGTLTLAGRAGGALQVRERITRGPCSRTGTITMTRSGADEFLFVYVPDDRTYTANGVLARK
jgi:hypothetical protein